MICRSRGLRKWTCNGILLLIVCFFLSLCLLNLVNPALPSIRCSGNKTDDPRISHISHGDTVTATVLLCIVCFLPLVQLFLTEVVYYGDLVSSFTLSRRGTSGPHLRADGRWKSAFKYSGTVWRDYIFGLIFTMFLNDIGKSTVNAPRPHFVTTCRPKFTETQCHLGWVDSYECTNRELSDWRMADSRKSFPSGHAAASMFSAVFMILYQHRRLSLSRHGGVVLFWCHFSWLAWGLFCSLSRVVDFRHHPIDIFVGGLIGVLGALFTAVIICESFRDEDSEDSWSGRRDDAYQAESGGRVNAGATVLDGSDTVRHSSGALNGALPNSNNGSNGDVKRPSLRRLISNQSVLTQMSDIPEDNREIELI